MLRKFINLLSIIFCLFTIAVSAQTGKAKMAKKNSQPYIGCWSGGNAPPSIYQFTRNTIKTSVTHGKLFHYRQIFSDGERRVYLLELKEKDAQNYLQKFLAVKFTGNDSVELTDYETMQGFEQDRFVGRLNVFKEDDCQSLSNFFR